jgi:hypothetical protein
VLRAVKKPKKCGCLPAWGSYAQRKAEWIDTTRHMS